MQVNGRQNCVQKLMQPASSLDPVRSEFATNYEPPGCTTPLFVQAAIQFRENLDE